MWCWYVKPGEFNQPGIECRAYGPLLLKVNLIPADHIDTTSKTVPDVSDCFSTESALYFTFDIYTKLCLAFNQQDWGNHYGYWILIRAYFDNADSLACCTIENETNWHTYHVFISFFWNLHAHENNHSPWAKFFSFGGLDMNKYIHHFRAGSSMLTELVTVSVRDMLKYYQYTSFRGKVCVYFTILSFATEALTWPTYSFDRFLYYKMSLRFTAPENTIL